jgi:polyhydroxyalkanoic acid synthase PhaR subunit
MPDRAAADPLALWRSMVSQWEKNVNDVANKNMGTEQFSGSMNSVMNASLQAQAALGDVMAKYLAALNLPSRADVLALGEQLGAIESRLATIAVLLEQRDGAAEPAVKTPKRTKRPPKP